MFDFLRPIADEVVERIVECSKSQTALSDQIDRLNEEIQRVDALAKTPALEPYTKKLASARQRLEAASRAMAAIEGRVASLSQAVLTREQQQLALHSPAPAAPVEEPAAAAAAPADAEADADAQQPAAEAAEATPAADNE
eukprot:m51a1_g12420 hypothetical protein (140) ;mRNA; f:762765-763301